MATLKAIEWLTASRRWTKTVTNRFPKKNFERELVHCSVAEAVAAVAEAEPVTAAEPTTDHSDRNAPNQREADQARIGEA